MVKLDINSLVKGIISKLFFQFRTLFSFYIKLYSPIFILLFAFALISVKTGIPIPHFTRDPLQIMNGKFYYGIISNIGVMFWCFCAAICFFSSYFLSGKTNSKDLSLFLKYSGIATTILLLDDFFLFHDMICTDYLYIRERFIMGAYALLMVVYLIRFSSFILKTEFCILFLAFTFFGLSVIFDFIVGKVDISFLYIFEDGFKLLAIISWFAYFTRLSFQGLKSVLNKNEN